MKNQLLLQALIAALGLIPAGSPDGGATWGTVDTYQSSGAISPLPPASAPNNDSRSAPHAH